MQGSEHDPVFSSEEIKILKKYVTDPESDVFCLLPTLAGFGGALFARYSRTSGGARVRLLKEFLDSEGKLNIEKLKGIIDRVLIAFGDDSIGEQESASLACENVSNLATKVLEDCRIGVSPIEKSTRYVVYDQRDRFGHWRYLRPPEIITAGLLEKYETAMDFIFQTYVDLVAPMSAYFRKLKPEAEAEYAIRPDDSVKYKLAELIDDKEIKAWQQTYRTDIRTKTCDTIRVLLPAATLTNVGFNGEGLAYQNMLTKLLSHNLEEMRNLGCKAKEALSKVIPQYIKRAQENEYLKAIDREMKKLVAGFYIRPIQPNRLDTNVDLFYAGEWMPRSMAVAHILYPYTDISLRSLYRFAHNLTLGEQFLIIETYCQHKNVRGNRRNKPGRALEFGYPIIFDLVGNFGIYRDLQRHRMLTQERQLLNPHLGYSIPEELREAGFSDQVEACVEKSKEICQLLHSVCGPEVAQYAVLFIFNIRWYMGMNYREAFHLMELRTIPQGHPSYRHLVQEMHRKLLKKDPSIASLMEFVDYNDYFWSRAESESAQRRKESQL
jgi:thymidylate synthase ThyX